MRYIVASTSLALAILLAGAAQAATTGGNLNIQATVVDTCSVTDASLDFGTVDPAAGTTVPATTTIDVTCNLGTGYSVGLNDGANASSGARRLKRGSATEYLGYELYQDPTATTRFGDAVEAERVTELTGLGILPNVIPVYGQIAAGQAASAGVYSDVVQITVYY